MNGIGTEKVTIHKWAGEIFLGGKGAILSTKLYSYIVGYIVILLCTKTKFFENI